MAPIHSSRSAIIGSTIAALRAGSKVAATARAANDSQIENHDGRGAGAGVFAQDTKGIAKIWHRHMKMLPGRFAGNSPNCFHPDPQEIRCGAGFAVAVGKNQAELVGIVVAERSGICKQEAL